jgi:uncharacterized repeat protein (TIGR01451 family)
MKAARSVWFALALFALLVWLCSLPRAALATGDAPGTVIPPTHFSKTALASAPVVAENPVTYTIRFTRVPDFDIDERVWITDTLPAELAFVSGSAHSSIGSSPVISGRSLTWEGDVQPHGQVIITYTARVSAAVTNTRIVTNTATWRGRNRDNPPAYLELVDTASITVQARMRKFYAPLVVKKWLPDPPAQLANWNFDAGRTEWEELVNDQPGKIIYSAQEKPLPGTPAGWFAWLGGAPSQTNEIHQQHRLPNDHTALGLYFHYWLYSEERSCPSGDDVQVLVNDIELTAFQLCNDNDTFSPGDSHGWVELSPVLDLSRFKGMDVSIRIRSQLDGSANSNFYVDDVRICTNDPRVTVDRCP